MGENCGQVNGYRGQVLQSVSGWAGRRKISRNGGDMPAPAGFPDVLLRDRLKKQSCDCGMLQS